MILFFRCKLPSLKPFFRSYASQSGSGPPRDKLRAIPFTQHVKAADNVRTTTSSTLAMKNLLTCQHRKNRSLKTTMAKAFSLHVWRRRVLQRRSFCHFGSLLLVFAWRSSRHKWLVFVSHFFFWQVHGFIVAYKGAIGSSSVTQSIQPSNKTKWSGIWYALGKLSCWMICPLSY